MTSIRPAREAGVVARAVQSDDAEPLARMMSRAFHDDPLISFLLPDQASRPDKATRLFALLLKLGLPYGACYVTSHCEAAALWRPPGKWEIPFWQYIINGGEFLGLFGLGGAARVMSAMDVIEKRHPHEPHWYLQAVGTDPDRQGKGYGGLVIRRQLEAADAAGMPAYLESSKEKNIPIYQSFGFEVTGEIRPPGGPTLWPMWRPARTGG